VFVLWKFVKLIIPLNYSFIVAHITGSDANIVSQPHPSSWPQASYLAYNVLMVGVGAYACKWLPGSLSPPTREPRDEATHITLILVLKKNCD
jgi:hypothetical protein